MRRNGKETQLAYQVYAVEKKKRVCLAICLPFATINAVLGVPRGHLPDDLRACRPLISGHSASC